MGVQGRYFTNGTLANGGVAGRRRTSACSAVVDALLIQAATRPPAADRPAAVGGAGIRHSDALGARALA